MRRSNFFHVLASAVFFFASAGLSFSQPTFSIQNKKDACNSLQNGSFDILVTAATGSVSASVFGPPNTPSTPITIGTPLSITNLKGTAGGYSYLVVVTDDNGNSNVTVTIKLYSNVSGTTVVTDVTSCSPSNGAIDLTPSGGAAGSGSGSYSYAWTGPSGFTATTEDISGIGPGNYNVTISDANTVCTASLGPLTVNIASPTITPGSIPGVCSGTTTSTLPYSAATPGLDQYTIDWDAAAEAAGFTDVPYTALPATPISISGIPSVVSTTTFNGTLTAKNSGTGCVTSANAISITVTANVTPSVSIAASPNGAICAGTSVTFTATPTNGGVPSYQWKKNGSNVGTNSSTYIDAALANGDQMSVVMTTSLTCVTSPTATSNIITMTVNPVNTVGAASSTPTLCVNTALTAITHTTTGATGIGTATGLPTGVTASWAANTITISGTPTATGIFNYSIPLTGGCGTVNATGTITVTPGNTVGVASSTPTLCVNTALTAITHTTTGATGISNDGVSGANGLPSGVSAHWAANTITISGTPTASGTFNYSIPLTGGCGTVNATGTITVNPDNTVGAASSTPTLCVNTALTAITHTTTGATGIGAATGLPTGVTASWAANTITISGTPTASGTFNYSIPLTGGCGNVNATGTITVTPGNTVSVASSTPTLCVNTALTAITHTTTGATGISNDGVSGANGLPSGVSAHWAANTITISGTPTAPGTFNYSIPLTGGCGNVNATGTITVNPDNTITLSSALGTDNQSQCINTAITDITYNTTGATGATFSGLPTGVNGAWATNVATISGTPTASGTFNYTVTLTGGCGNVTATGIITVSDPPTPANAGADQGVCGVSTNLQGNTPLIGTGLWSIISGAGGSVTTPSSPTSAFTGTVGTSYTLRWTISNGACLASTDDVIIIFSTPPTTANAGPDQTACGTSTNLAGNTPATGSGIWTIVSGTGGSITTTTSPTSAFSGTVGSTYTLRWTISNGACTPSTDDVTITFDQAPTTAAAGSDQSICGTSATLAANTPTVGTGAWSIISGVGGTVTTLSDPTSTFTGTAANSYTLRWTISNGSCTASTDDVIITFDDAPTTANAGADQALCNVTTTSLAGNTPTTGTGQWTVVSGTATITTAGSPTSGVTGLVTGTATLRWTISNGSCPASTDDVVITVSAPPTTAAAGSDQNVCGPATMAANVPVVGTGAWSIITGSGGTFFDVSNPTSTFSGTPGTTYTLRWTISSGACTASTDDVDITFDNNSPTPANAGPDQNICGTSATLAANTPVVGTGGWSIVSGTGGSFVDASNPVSGFSGVQGNSYTLRWSITSGACPPSTDDVVITFDQNPTPANAGSDQTLCGTSATLAANAPTVGTGAWTITAGTGGSLANSTDPLSGFTGTQGTAYTLRWTISNGSCTASTDDVIITFDQAPTVANAGTDQSVCGTSSTLAANTPTIGTGLWSIVSGSGGSFVDATDPVTSFSGTQGVAYILRWTISNGTCTTSADSVNITLDQIPTTSNAGVDQTPCGPTTLAANAPTVGTGAWSVISGAGGLFGDANNPTSTFTGTAGTTYVLRWTISNGSCTPSTDDVQIQFDNNTPTTSAAGPDQNICGTSATLAANTPIVGTGAWTVVSGTGGSFADVTNPVSGFTGIADSVYVLRWTISTVGGCTPSTDDVQIAFSQTPTIAAAGADQSGCSTSVALAGNTPSVGTGTWTIVSGTGGTISNVSSPTSGFTGASGNSYTLRWTISNGSCTSSTDDVVITINPAGSCGGTNCGAFTIVATDTRPTCSGQDDGTITINVSGGSPNYVVILSDTSQTFSQALAGPGPFTFSNLSPSLKYQYTIKDVSGNTCTLPYSLPIQTNVQASATGFVNAKCFNQAVGQATLTVNSGGTSPYEYSLDAGTTWVSFTSPVVVNNLAPAVTPYSILVRDDATDQCPAQVMVTINNAVSDIQISSTTSDASCKNNDGSIQITSVTGGTGPYTYQFDGNGTTSLILDSLAGGNHTFTVIDSNSCTKNFPLTINFPGLVSFTAQSTSPDCTGTGTNGTVTVTITQAGNFDVGITTDPTNDPLVFQNVNSNGNTVVPPFLGLSQGNYYVVAKPTGALCPTRQLVAVSGGPFAVDFSYAANNFVCFDSNDKGTINVFGIKGSLAVAYNYEIINSGNVVQSGTISQLQALDTVMMTGIEKGSYQVHLFQDQSASTGCTNPISSAFKNFTVDGPAANLDTLFVTRKFSQTNLPTGSMLIAISESQEPSYQIMLHLLEPKRAGQTNMNVFDSTWVTATRNNQDNNIEYNATGLYAGDYRLYLRDTLGCEKTYDLSIDYNRELFIPNIFTPNNDNKNDTFEILNLPSNSSVVISNRWGKEVYRSSELKLGVDGITTVVWNGGSESDGIYYYTLNAGGKTYTGWVELLHPSTN
ncbi:MAG: gliding motility-associated C-terminal domain-containing protein [Bacteroidetes bacterium]|nr:gliding motility-associated C-terminal domain-containing protein [Bacteroidota bacterium]